MLRSAVSRHPRSAQRRRLGQRLASLAGLGLCLGPGLAAARPGDSLEALNHALEALARQPAQPDQVAALLDVAAQRQDLLGALVERDPGQVLALALPEDVRQELPAAVRARVERHVELEGEVTALYEDHPDHAVLRHFLEADGRRRSLHLAGEQPDLLTGDRVRVQGVEVPLRDADGSGAVVATCCGGDGLLALAGGKGKGNGGGSGGGDTGGPVPEPVATGEHRVLTILVNFEDDPAEPYTPAEAHDVVFGTTNEFVMEGSYGRTWLSGDVTGWYTVPLASADCDLFAIAAEARAAASAAGFDLAAYQHHVYAFPRGGCTGVAVGTLGGSPSQAWIIDDLDLKALSHELGHNLGLHHAHALDCGDAVLGPSCTVLEYGDRMDTMGNVAAGHYNAFSKDLLGWLDSGGAPPITEVQTDGVYTIAPLEMPGSVPAALVIPKSVDPATSEETWYYVEYRQAIGFDAFLAGNENVLNGVVVHTGSPTNGNSSDQLDMTPGSGLQNWSDWSDPALEVGESFHDPDSGVTIGVLALGSAAAEISVTFAAPGAGDGSGSGLELSAASDRAVYGWKETAVISAIVTAGGAPVSGASVSFEIADPVGETTLRDAATGDDGIAAVGLRFRRSDPRGAYRVHVEVTAGDFAGAEAWTSFALE